MTRRAVAAVSVAGVLVAGLLAGCGSSDEAAPGTGSAVGGAHARSGAAADAASGADASVPLGSPVAPEAVPDAVPAPAELPACAYADLPTRRGELADWSTTMLDTAVMLGADYYPDDLVPVGTSGVEGWGEVRAVMIDDLRAMDGAAREAGASFAVRSAFRDYATQRDNFQSWVAKIGETAALGESARPGHSEHQLGTALDLRSADSTTPAWEYTDWGQTPTGAWLRENSWEYGFVLSYPAGQSALTCYDYESWHFRYVGRDVAGQIHASGLTPREHLWRTSESLP